MINPLSAANILGVSRDTIKRWCDNGTLQSIRGNDKRNSRNISVDSVILHASIVGNKDAMKRVELIMKVLEKNKI